MNLYLHIGTEKTGSSFLQQVCALNREWLSESGFYFPKAGKHEKRLISGTISPGNAKELADLIESNAWDRVDLWLAECIARAKAQACENLLLSHELLFSLFDRKDVLQRITDMLERLGVARIRALLFVRDPVDHAISLYKHRGKGGHIAPIEEWIRVNYSTAAELEGLIRAVESSGFQLSVRKYQTQSRTLLATFFVDWLGLEQPPRLPEGRVNPSLTLSEIELLRHLAGSRSDDIPLFYRNLLAISREEKCADDQLEHQVRLAVADYLYKFNNTWIKLDQLTGEDGGLEMPEPHSSTSKTGTHYSFSSSQLSAIAKSYDEARTLRHSLTVLFNRYLRPPLSKVKRVLLP